jgi:hypothetical protein
VTAENVDAFADPEYAKDWPERTFAPSAGQIAGGVGLVACGCFATLGIARLGREKPVKRGAPGDG